MVKMANFTIYIFFTRIKRKNIYLIPVCIQSCCFPHLNEDYLMNITSIILHGERQNFLRSGTRQGCPLLSLLFNIVLEILAKEVRQEKETKDIQTGKEEVKLSLFTDDMILYVENPEDSTQKNLLELINKFSKVEAYKTNKQNPVSFVKK